MQQEASVREARLRRRQLFRVFDTPDGREVLERGGNPYATSLRFLHVVRPRTRRSRRREPVSYTHLDAAAGFLHRDRPGRPGMALDLMEEFRAPLADRLALTLINRKQISAEMCIRDSG